MIEAIIAVYIGGLIISGVVCGYISGGDAEVAPVLLTTFFWPIAWPLLLAVELGIFIRNKISEES